MKKRIYLREKETEIYVGSQNKIIPRALPLNDGEIGKCRLFDEVSIEENGFYPITFIKNVINITNLDGTIYSDIEMVADNIVPVKNNNGKAVHKIKDAVMRTKNVAKKDVNIPGLVDGVSLFDYQVDILKFMDEREKATDDSCGVKGGIIALTMGMGKTLCCLCHIALSRVRKKENPTLVISSLTVFNTWVTHIEDYFPKLKILVLHSNNIGSEAIKNMQVSDLHNYDIVITNYHMLSNLFRDNKQLLLLTDPYNPKIVIKNEDPPSEDPRLRGKICIYNTCWERVICDESQTFANPTTNFFLSVMSLYSKYRWCLTGTPIRNATRDVISQIRFLGFDTRKCQKTPSIVNNYIYKSNFKNEGIIMPYKISQIKTLTFSKEEMVIYSVLLKLLKEKLEDFFDEVEGRNFSYILSLITSLRQFCIAPWLLLSTAEKKKSKKAKEEENAKKDVEGALSSYQKGWLKNREGNAGMGSTKITELTDLIVNLHSTYLDDKIIVFSVFVEALKLLKDSINERGVKSYILTGKTPPSVRSDMIHAFQKNENVRVLFMSYKVGSEGINLQRANRIVCVEPWWNSSVHNQAIARCWRTGQKKDVGVYWVSIAGSIEIPIFNFCKYKDEVSFEFFEKANDFVLKRPGIDKNVLRDIAERAVKYIPVFENSEDL